MHIIVPIKKFSQAKTRLASCFTPLQRQVLAREMALHVLRELSRVDGIDGVTIATSEPFITPIANELGFDILLDEPEDSGLNVAIDRSVNLLTERGAGEIGVVSADLPLFHHVAFAQLLDNVHRSGFAQQVTMVSDRWHDGTNVRLCRPGNMITAFYGRNSLNHHRKAARKAGAEVIVADSATMMLDLDEPRDLQALHDGARSIAAPDNEVLSLLAAWQPDWLDDGEDTCAKTRS